MLETAARALCDFMTALRKGTAQTPDGVLPEFLAILLKYPGATRVGTPLARVG